MTITKEEIAASIANINDVLNWNQQNKLKKFSQGIDFFL